MNHLTPADRVTVAKQLLDWFDQHHRTMPWRADRDPYRIWVSEVMLQQTQVATVVPFFERFMLAFPSVNALAAADEQEVLRLWSGLGYYRRARHLHQAARILVRDHDGEMPDDPVVWRELPGVGRYILGAVLSQAFDRKLPIVEANSQRVLARLFGWREQIKASSTQRWLWQTAAELLPEQRVGDFNQAIMELGSLVCTVSEPACGRCPLAPWCVAKRDELQTELPVKSARPALVAVREVAVVIRQEAQVFLVQRPDAGRWAGMWEFPHTELVNPEDPEQAALRLVTELGMKATIGNELLTIRHGIMHYQVTLICLEAIYQSGDYVLGPYPQARWVAPTGLSEYPVSVPQRKLAEHLLEPHRQPRLF